MTQQDYRESNIRKLIGEMKKGRKLSLYDHYEFHLAEMHTSFHKIHRMIEAGKIQGWKWCSEWRSNKNNYGVVIRFKVYWLEQCEN